MKNRCNNFKKTKQLSNLFIFLLGFISISMLSSCNNVELQELATPTRVVQLSSGNAHNCALYSDNTATCWGDNQSQQLGRAAATTITPITQADGTTPLNDISRIYSGNKFNCALQYIEILTTRRSQIYCWGTLQDSETANNIVQYDRPTRMPISGSDIFIIADNAIGNIAIGENHVCTLVLTENDRREIICWGDNQYGQLGRGGTDRADADAYTLPIFTTNASTQPTENNPNAVNTSSSISLLVSGDNHSCAIVIVGDSEVESYQEIHCWGDNQFGQLGREESLTMSASPLPIQEINTDTATAGAEPTIDFRRLVPTTDQNTTTSIIDMEAGANHTCILVATTTTQADDTNNTEYTIKCWGDNRNNQIVAAPTVANADCTDHCRILQNIPLVGYPNDVINPAIAAIALGGNQTCVRLAVNGVTNDVRASNVSCWDDNTSDRLGTNNQRQGTAPLTISEATPVYASPTDSDNLTLFEGVSFLSLGAEHLCAIVGGNSTLVNPRIWCWGNNPITGQILPNDNRATVPNPRRVNF